MAKFKVKVKVVAEYEYETETEADNEKQANEYAFFKWPENMPSDFQVNKDYVVACNIDSEQLTAECPKCGKEHTISHADLSLRDADCWYEDYEYCKDCGAKIEAEEKA